MTGRHDLPNKLQEVLTNITQALVDYRPLPEGDYGTVLFDAWLRARPRSERSAASIAFLDKKVRELTDNRQAIVASHPRYFARSTGGGLLIALVPCHEEDANYGTRHFCIAAANINGVFESRQEDFSAIEL